MDLPKTTDEAVDVLIEKLRLRDKREIADTPFEDLAIFHFSLGLPIRNLMGLWGDNQELFESCRAFAGGAAEFQADDASAVIINELWKRLQTLVKLRVVG